MRFLFTILSIVYIAGIFLFVDSSVVSDLSSFNPYSLLHIPLYGVLTFLLVCSFIPMTQLRNNPIDLPRLSCLPHETLFLFHWGSESVLDEMRPAQWSVKTTTWGSLFHRGQLPNYLITRFLVVGLIALIVAITDEIHQAYVPGRDASLTDVLLDFVGITLVLFFVIYLFRKRQSLKTQLTQ